MKHSMNILITDDFTEELNDSVNNLNEDIADSIQSFFEKLELQDKIRDRIRRDSGKEFYIKGCRIG